LGFYCHRQKEASKSGPAAKQGWQAKNSLSFPVGDSMSALVSSKRLPFFLGMKKK